MTSSKRSWRNIESDAQADDQSTFRFGSDSAGAVGSLHAASRRIPGTPRRWIGVAPLTGKLTRPTRRRRVAHRSRIILPAQASALSPSPNPSLTEGEFLRCCDAGLCRSAPGSLRIPLAFDLVSVPVTPPSRFSPNCAVCPHRSRGGPRCGTPRAAAECWPRSAVRSRRPWGRGLRRRPGRPRGRRLRR